MSDKELLSDTAELLAGLIKDAKGGREPTGQGADSEGREVWSIADRLKLVEISTKFIAAKQRIDADSGEDASEFHALRERLHRGRKTAN